MHVAGNLFKTQFVTFLTIFDSEALPNSAVFLSSLATQIRQSSHTNSPPQIDKGARACRVEHGVIGALVQTGVLVQMEPSSVAVLQDGHAPSSH